MIELLADKEQQLEFEVQIEGASPDNVDATFKIKFGKLEVGFPAEVSENSITVTVPKLKSVLRSEFKKPVTGVAVLETVIEGCYKVPWRDKVQIKREVQIEAKLSGAKKSKSSKPTIKAKIKTLSESNSKTKQIQDILEKVLD